MSRSVVCHRALQSLTPTWRSPNSYASLFLDGTFYNRGYAMNFSCIGPNHGDRETVISSAPHTNASAYSTPRNARARSRSPVPTMNTCSLIASRVDNAFAAHCFSAPMRRFQTKYNLFNAAPILLRHDVITINGLYCYVLSDLDRIHVHVLLRSPSPFALNQPVLYKSSALHHRTSTI